MNIYIVKQKDVEALVPIELAIQALKNIFLEYESNQLTVPNRNIINIKNSNALALIMPSYNSKTGIVGVKVSSIVPSNLEHNLPLIHSVILLLDEKDGQVKALVDGSAVTRIRTGAVCGLATQLLAPKTATNLAIIGTGKQSYFIAKAICSIRKISKVFLYSRTPEKGFLLKEYIQKSLGISDVAVCKNAKEAIEDTDIICTATSNTSNYPVIDINDIPRNRKVLINAIGGASISAFELPPELYSEANIVVEDPVAASRECGEISYNIANNNISQESLQSLGKIIQGNINLKRNITIFRSVGMAIEDLAILQEVFTSRQLDILCSKIVMG